MDVKIRAQVASHPVAATQTDILVVGTQHHLCALLYHMAIFVETGVKGRFFAAPADSFDLLQLVRQHQQMVAAREQVALEVGAETVADDGDAAVIDEAQFLTKDEVYYLVHLVDECDIPVICYGLRADFKGELFPGSYHLLVLADKLEEVKTICWCGKKAAFNARFDENGRVVKEGAQVVLGANDKYIGLCRRHWMAGDLGPDFDIRSV